jgi:hypothetical protein
MSTYRGHIAGGIVTYALTAYTVLHLFPTAPHAWRAQLLFLGCAILGSLFPDIDTRSTIQKLFFVAMIPALPLSLFYNVSFFLCLVAICLGALFIPHRTLTHRPWFIVALSAILAGIILTKVEHHRLLFAMCSVYFCAGALSHWFLDFGFRRLIPKK